MSANLRAAILENSFCIASGYERCGREAGIDGQQIQDVAEFMQHGENSRRGRGSGEIADDERPKRIVEDQVTGRPKRPDTGYLSKKGAIGVESNGGTRPDVLSGASDVGLYGSGGIH